MPFATSSALRNDLTGMPLTHVEAPLLSGQSAGTGRIEKVRVLLHYAACKEEPDLVCRCIDRLYVTMSSSVYKQSNAAHPDPI